MAGSRIQLTKLRRWLPKLALRPLAIPPSTFEMGRQQVHNCLMLRTGVATTQPLQ